MGLARRDKLPLFPLFGARPGQGAKEVTGHLKRFLDRLGLRQQLGIQRRTDHVIPEIARLKGQDQIAVTDGKTLAHRRLSHPLIIRIVAPYMFTLAARKDAAVPNTEGVRREMIAKQGGSHLADKADPLLQEVLDLPFRLHNAVCDRLCRRRGGFDLQIHFSARTARVPHEI